MRGGKRDSAGRKSARIDLAELEKLCALQCTDNGLTAYFGVTARTIERRRQKPAFAAAMESGRAKGRLSLRRSLFTQAIDGNTAASIFLAKNVWATGMSVATNTAGPTEVPLQSRTGSILRGFRPRTSSNCRPWSTRRNVAKEKNDEHASLRF
jgi:hypothetical protein